ncbi:MAG: hypothetical protein V3V00_07075 [Saprospiraceae bacterium]
MRTFLSILISTFVFTLSAQNKTWDSVIEGLHNSSTEYLTAFVKKDWDKYMSYSHPNIIEMAGGKEVLMKVAEETVAMYQSIGFKLESGKVIGDIETVDSSEGIQAIIPASLEMSSEGQENTQSPLKLFAISSDGGENWIFVDLSRYDPSTITRFVPEFSEDLKKFW